MKWIALIAVSMIVGAAILLLRKTPASEPSLDLQSDSSQPEGPSLYDLILAHVGENN